MCAPAKPADPADNSTPTRMSERTGRIRSNRCAPFSPFSAECDHFYPTRQRLHDASRYVQGALAVHCAKRPPHSLDSWPAPQSTRRTSRTRRRPRHLRRPLSLQSPALPRSRQIRRSHNHFSQTYNIFRSLCSTHRCALHTVSWLTVPQSVAPFALQHSLRSLWPSLQRISRPHLLNQQRLHLLRCPCRMHSLRLSP